MVQPPQQVTNQQQNQNWDMGDLLGGGSTTQASNQNQGNQQAHQVYQQPQVQVHPQVQQPQVQQQNNPMQGNNQPFFNQYSNQNQFNPYGQGQMNQYGNMNMGNSVDHNSGYPQQTQFQNQGYNPQVYQQPQQSFYHQPQPVYHQPPQQQAPQQNFQISLSTNQNTKKDDDDFGGFESGNTNKVGWMSSAEANLTDFSDLSDMKPSSNQKNK